MDKKHPKLDWHPDNRPDNYMPLFTQKEEEKMVRGQQGQGQKTRARPPKEYTMSMPEPNN